MIYLESGGLHPLQYLCNLLKEHNIPHSKIKSIITELQFTKEVDFDTWGLVGDESIEFCLQCKRLFDLDSDGIPVTKKKIEGKKQFVKDEDSSTYICCECWEAI